MPRVKIDDSWYPLSIKGGIPEWLPRSIQVFPPQVSQEDMAEAQLPADKRPAVTIRDVSGGYGLDEQPLEGSITRFDRIGDTSGEGVDASLSPAGPILLGPAVWDTGLSSGTGIAGVRSVQGGGALSRVFRGADVSEFNGWVPVNKGTLPSTITGQPFQFRGTQTTSSWWYAPQGQSTVPQYSTDSGGTWTAISSAGGVTGMVDAAVIDGEVLYLYAGVYGTALRRFQDGGPTPTAYGTIDPISQRGILVERIINWNDRAVIFSQQEVLLLAKDKSSLTQSFLTDLTMAGDVIYLSGVHVWRGMLWIPTTQGLFAVSPDGGTQVVGPDGSELSRSAGAGGALTGHKGVIQAICGDAYNLYGVVVWEAGQSTDSTYGWLFKANVTISNGRVSDIQWFPVANLGLITNCNGMTIIRHEGVTSSVKAKSLLLSVYRYTGAYSNQATYLVRLPTAGRDPRQEPHYRYALNGTFYPSRLNARFMAFSKDWLSVLPRVGDLGYGVDGQTAVTGLGLQVRYKADSVPLTANGPYGYSTTTTQGATEATGVRVDLSGVRARGLDLAIRFSTSHAFSNHSPQLYAVTTDYRTAPDSIWQHSLVLDISSGAYKDDGSGGYGDPLPPDAAYRKLRTLPNKAPFEFVDPMGNSATCFVPSGGIQIAPQGMPEEGYGDNALPLKIPIFLVEVIPASEATR